MNNTRILDKSTYSRKTIETFEIIAAYYVDIFYNHLYFEAKKMRNDKVVTSITEGYKHALTSFMQGIEDPKMYKKSLLAMHTFFIENEFSNLTFTQCMERVTMEFIPIDYYESVLNSKRSAILRVILNNVNKNFILKLVNNYLSMIIDQHNEDDNTRILQDEFIDLLLIEKESMYKKFVVGKTKTNDSFAKKGIIEMMQKEIKTLCKEKYDLRKLNFDLKKIIISKETQHNLNIQKIEQLNNIINELKNELEAKNNPIIPEELPVEKTELIINEDVKYDDGNNNSEKKDEMPDNLDTFEEESDETLIVWD